MEGKASYNLSLEGLEPKPGARERTAEALMLLFGKSAEECRAILDGEMPLTLKSGADREELRLLGELLKNAGAAVAISGGNEPAVVISDSIVQQSAEQLPALLSQADQFFRQGRFQDAAHLFARASKSNPGSSAPFIGLARSLARLGLADHAIVQYRNALCADPSACDAAVGIAELLLARGRSREAQQILAPFYTSTSAKPEVLFVAGITHLALNESAQAAQLFAAVLKLRPDNPRAWYFNGEALRLSGVSGEDSYRRALVLDPGFNEAAVWYCAYLAKQARFGELNLILGPLEARLRAEQKLPQELLPLLQEIRSLVAANPPAPIPGVADAVRLIAAGEKAEGLSRLAELAAQKPAEVTLMIELGNARYRTGDLAGAEEQYLKALNLAPGIEAQYNLASVFLSQRKLEQARAGYERAVRIDPGHYQSRLSLAHALAELDLLEDALLCAEEAVRRHPQVPDPHLVRSRILLRLNMQEQALAAVQAACALAPQSRECLLLRAECERGVGDNAAAAASARLALVGGESADAYHELGAALFGLDCHDEAAECFRKALELRPDFASALNNLGNVAYTSRNESPESALAHFNRALEKDGTAEIYRWNRSLMLLLRGDYAQGWRDYEARIALQKRLPQFPQPRWDGADLKGRTILVVPEQGFGDNIQCARYLPLLAERGVRVLCETRPELRRLFASLKGVEVLDPARQTTPNFQTWSPIMSLPHLFGTTLENIPASTPYLSGGAPRSAALRLPKRGRARIGFVYSGSSTQPLNRYRACPVGIFAKLFELTWLDFYCLQREVDDEARSCFARYSNVSLLGERFADFADTASVIDQLDLVISVDTSVAHLAGALGKDTWVLLSANASWQWLLEREDSPWYPSARLFRCRPGNDWDEAVSKLLAALRERFVAQAKLQESSTAAKLKEVESCAARGEHEQGRMLAESIMSVEPYNAAAAAAAAVCALRAGDLRRAERYFKTATELDPWDLAIYREFAAALSAHGDYAAAASAADEALALSGREPPDLLRAADIRAAAGDFSIAVDLLYEAVRKNPRDGALLVRLGELLFKQGALEEARTSYLTAYIVEPQLRASHPLPPQLSAGALSAPVLHQAESA